MVGRFHTHARCLALAILGATALALCPGWACAGGNLEIRHPANPSIIVPTHWDTRRLPIRWLLSKNGLPGSGIDIATLETEIQAAFDAWQALPTSAAAFTFGGQVDTRDAQLGGALALGVDGRNLVTFTDPDLVFAPGVLALSLTTSFTGDFVVTAANADLDGDGTADLPVGTYPAGSIFDSDIALNSSAGWSVTGAAGTNDVRAVALHEVGHMLGLCHSAIRDAVMWPFLSEDVQSVRLPAPDDVAWVSRFYPSEPAASAAFGRIAGTVTNGANGLPILGAHVYVVDPATQASVVGGYTRDDGGYELPGLTPGNWLVAVEPLDGDPPGTEPFRVNNVVAGTLDTNFPDEFRDANEGAVETDPTAATAVPVTAGATAGAIDVVTNTLTLPAASVSLPAGFSLFAWPVGVPAGTTAFDLLEALGGPTEVSAVDRFDPRTGAFERAEHATARRPASTSASVAARVRRLHAAGADRELHGGDRLPGARSRTGAQPDRRPVPARRATRRSRCSRISVRALEVDRVARLDPETQSLSDRRLRRGRHARGRRLPDRAWRGLHRRDADAEGRRQDPAPGREVTPRIERPVAGPRRAGHGGRDPGRGLRSDAREESRHVQRRACRHDRRHHGTVTAVVPGAATSGPVRVTIGGKVSNALDFVVEPAVVHPATARRPSSCPVRPPKRRFGGRRAGPLHLHGARRLGRHRERDGAQSRRAGSRPRAGGSLRSDRRDRRQRRRRHRSAAQQLRADRDRHAHDRRHERPRERHGRYRRDARDRDAAGRDAGLHPRRRRADGEPGTELTDPLTVFATGPTGAPLAGIPVTYRRDGGRDQGLSLPGPIEAATIVVSTNASGIVSITSQLPNKSGLFTIQVAIPGAKPVTFKVAAMSGARTQVTMSGNDQTRYGRHALAAPIADRAARPPPARRLRRGRPVQAGAGGGARHADGQPS